MFFSLNILCPFSMIFNEKGREEGRFLVPSNDLNIAVDS